MNRDQLASWLGLRYGKYLEACGRPATDTPNGLQPPIDDALLALGYPSDQIVTAAPTSDADVANLTASASFQTMLQINRDLGAQAINITTPEGSIQLRNMRDAAETDLKLCGEILASRGLAASPEDGTGNPFATWNTNYLGPAWV